MQKLRSIQVLRGLAACGVVACHAAKWHLGAAGVDIFFVISGFIIASIAPGRSASSFMMDRAWRVLPPYWIATIPLLGAVPLRLAASLTLWPYWGRIVPPYLEPAWTLSFEMLFYVAAALAVATGRVWMPLAAYMAALVLYLTNYSTLFVFIGNPIILEFFAGVALTRVKPDKFVGWIAIVVAVIIFSMAPSTILDHDPFIPKPGIDEAFGQWGLVLRVLIWGPAAAALVYGALSFEQAFRSRLWHPLVVLGDASYSIYLVHWLPTHLALKWPLRIILAVLSGLAFHFACERPLLGLRKRLGVLKLATPVYQTLAMRSVFRNSARNA